MGVVECIDRMLKGDDKVTVSEAWVSGMRGQWDVEQYLFEHHWSKRVGEQVSLNMWGLPDKEREALRWHAKRIWELMDPLIRKRAAQGGPGIYSVLLSYRTVGWVTAVHQDQARALARALYGWLEGEHGSLEVQLWYDTDDERVARLNDELKARAEMNLKDARKQLDRYQRDIELWESVNVMISTGSV